MAEQKDKKTEESEQGKNKQKFAAPNSKQFIFTHLQRKRKRRNTEEEA